MEMMWLGSNLSIDEQVLLFKDTTEGGLKLKLLACLHPGMCGCLCGKFTSTYLRWWFTGTTLKESFNLLKAFCTRGALFKGFFFFFKFYELHWNSPASWCVLSEPVNCDYCPAAPQQHAQSTKRGDNLWRKCTSDHSMYVLRSKGSEKQNSSGRSTDLVVSSRNYFLSTERHLPTVSLRRGRSASIPLTLANLWRLVWYAILQANITAVPKRTPLVHASHVVHERNKVPSAQWYGWWV